MKLKTDRLLLREMTEADFDAIYRILGDKLTMYAYEHAFTPQEAKDWMAKQFRNYEKYGYGLWAVILKESGELIGQCGLTRQLCGDYGEVLEIGYLFNRNFWHHGYATEAASACKQYAFDVLGAEEVYSIIRDNNFASQHVAERNGMHKCGSFVKHYYGIDMPHYVYCVKRSEDNK